MIEPITDEEARSEKIVKFMIGNAASLAEDTGWNQGRWEIVQCRECTRIYQKEAYMCHNDWALHCPHCNWHFRSDGWKIIPRSIIDSYIRMVT